MNIRYTDPNTSSWAKSMVRYSTSAIPTTITDGTLVVTSTTQNQYSTNPYALSGLGMGTFYFSIFALDSNDRIIDRFSQEVSTDIQPVSITFSYTGSDQVWTVPYSQDYIITCKGAGSNTSAGGLGQGVFTLAAGTKLSIMVGQNGASTSSTTYGFGGSSNYSNNRAGGGLSGVFTGDTTILATDSARALVIGGGAGGGCPSGSRNGGAGGGETGGTGGGSNYGTAGGGGTQTGRNSGGNAGANQFNGGNGSGAYGRGGGGGWRGGRSSIGDGSGDDDKGAGGGSGYVLSTATSRVLTQGGGAASNNNGEVTIVSV